jgi:cell pole-organizing protein PopZ
MANPGTAHEPSMEEILASIRQIISEDGEGHTAARSESRGVARAEPEQEDREEREDLAGADNGLQRQGGSSYGELMRQQAMEAPQRVAQAGGNSNRDVAHADRDEEDRHLLSENSDTAVSGAFSALAHTILAQNARTLEDLVTEMLKPMLKGWLDDNLPGLVERLVQEEIQRVSRGRR